MLKKAKNTRNKFKYNNAQKTSKRKATVRITVNDYDIDTLDALIRR